MSVVAPSQSHWISGKECVQHSSFSSSNHSCNCSYRWDLQQLVLFQIFTGFPFHRLWSINHFQLLMHCKYTYYFNTMYSSWLFFTSRPTKSRTRKSERGFILFNIQSRAKTLARLSKQFAKLQTRCLDHRIVRHHPHMPNRDTALQLLSQSQMASSIIAKTSTSYHIIKIRPTPAWDRAFLASVM